MRLLSVAFSAFTSFCFFVVPATVMAVLMGFPELLGLFPALICICLIAASFAMLVTLWIVRQVGARRARSWVQIMNLLLTLVVVFGLQVPGFLLETEADATNFAVRLQGWMVPGSLFAADSWIWLPAKSMVLDPVAVGVMLGLSGAIAAGTVYLLSQAFVKGTQQSVSRKRPLRSGDTLAFQSGFSRVVLTKEWRTIRRHPYLISQVALQVALVIPLTYIMLRGDSGTSPVDISRAANVAMPFLGGQLAYVLTFVCVSGEEAPDLLKSSPAAGASFRRLKQLAALIPVWLTANACGDLFDHEWAWVVFGGGGNVGGFDWVVVFTAVEFEAGAVW